ncbi:MAG: LptF/LptG family permease [Rhizobiales bacterium]|nr:LptF/LptG family permease [Hyphomicrobiales bacterium]
MDLFSRYVFMQASNALIMIVGSLSAIVWIATSLKQLEGLSGGFFLFLKMTTLAMPQAMAIVAPIAFLIACLYSLNKLNLDSELIIMTASGATVWRFIMPYAVLGVLVGFLVLMSNLFIQPASLQKLRSYITQVRADLITHVLQAGKFSSPRGKMTFHIRDRKKNGDLLGLLVSDERSPKVHLTYLAEEGEMIKLDGSVYLKMKNGHIHRKLSDKNNVQIVKFDQYIFDLSEFGRAKGGKALYKPRARYLPGLLNPPASELNRPKIMGRIRAEIHGRFSGALYPILFAFIAVAALGVARSTRQNSSKLLIIGFCVGLAARMGGLAALNVLKVHPEAVWLVYGIPVGGTLVCMLYIWQSMSPEIFAKFLPASLGQINGSRKKVRTAHD